MEMPDELDIAEDELLGLLQQDNLAEGEGITTRELAAKLGKSTEWVRKRVRRWWDEGKIKVSKRREKDMLGRDTWVPVYKLQKESSREEEENHV